MAKTIRKAKKTSKQKKYIKSSPKPKSTDSFSEVQASRTQSSTQFGNAYTPPRYNTAMQPKLPTSNTQLSQTSVNSVNFAKSAKSNKFQLFILPYGVHRYVSSFASKANEFTGGSMSGAQANLPKGISLGAYLGYEYAFVFSTLKRKSYD